MAHPAHAQIRSHLASKYLVPSEAWLTSTLATQKPTTPLAALKQTTLFRLLASDLTQSLAQTGPSSCFPTDVLDANLQERRVPGPVAVQLLDLEDIGRSKWSQVESLEAGERGETTKGREVIRTVAGEEGLESVGAAGSSHGPFKLLLQDSRGIRVYAIEVSSVQGIGSATSIGAKLVLKDFCVSRGVVLLDGSSATVVGGKVGEWDTRWRAERKERLLQSLTAES